MRELLALLVPVLVFFLVCFVLKPRGLRAQVSALGFIVVLISTQLLMKKMSLPPHRYHFPACVTVLHYLTVWAFLSVHFAIKRKSADYWEGPFDKLGSWRQYVKQVMPIALSLPLSVVFNNQALVLIGAGAASVIGTLTPANTAMMQHVLGRRMVKAAWFGVLTALAGGYLIAQGELSAAQSMSAESDSDSVAVVTGLLYAFAAMVFRSMKSVLQDRLLKPEAYGIHHRDGLPIVSLDAMETLALQTPACAAVAMCYALGVERPSEAWQQLTPTVAPIVVMSCLSALVLNVLGMFSVSFFGASSAQMIGKLNIIVVMAMSTAFFHEEMPWQVVAGAMLVIVGIMAFENAEARAKETAVVLPRLDAESSHNSQDRQL